MEKYKYNESNGLWYELQGNYYLPCLKLPEEEQVHIGIWGQRHLNYLRENRRALLSDLQLSGKLNGYLADIDRQAEEVFNELGYCQELDLLTKAKKLLKPTVVPAEQSIWR